MKYLAMNKAKKIGWPAMKEALLFVILFGFVLLVNLPVVSFDMMYPEQPLIYAANQMLHSWQDLFHVYFHPQMFHVSILFFRPSGHFLLYQLLAPWLGWHNTQAFILINLGFLALTGCVILKLYALLFPNFRVGGYLAVGVYLMHPALMLSRLIILHFEYAYVFFTLFSLYCFALFCQRGLCHFYLLASSLLLYVIAVTFKEPAIFLGPVLLAYLCCSFYHGQAFLSFMRVIVKNKSFRELSLLILMVCFCLMLYLSLQWPTLKHPLRGDMHAAVILAALQKLWHTTWGLPDHFFAPPVWRNVVFPPLARFILMALGIFTGWSTLLIFLAKNKPEGDSLEHKKSLVFLYLTSFLFLILPVCWGWGLPWHLSLSLLFLSMLMGWSTEYLCQRLIKNKMGVYVLCLVMALAMGLAAIQVNQANIQYIVREQGFPLAVGRNAVLHPPALRAQLNAASVLVVEDSRIHDAYLLGASIYPYFFSFKLSSPNLNADQKDYEQAKRSMFIKQQPVYNGTLFKWAYLMPELQEEVYPFKVEQMQAVPDLILYDWLQHYDNIFCLGYDEQANWHDRSAIFKEKLLLEKARRQLVVNQYELSPATALEGGVSHTLVLPGPIPQLCQLECDQNKQCEGFTYLDFAKENKSIRECLFYNSLAAANRIFCPACELFVKK